MISGLGPQVQQLWNETTTTYQIAVYPQHTKVLFFFLSNYALEDTDWIDDFSKVVVIDKDRTVSSKSV